MDLDLIISIVRNTLILLVTSFCTIYFYNGEIYVKRCLKKSKTTEFDCIDIFQIRSKIYDKQKYISLYKSELSQLKTKKIINIEKYNIRKSKHNYRTDIRQLSEINLKCIEEVKTEKQLYLLDKIKGFNDQQEILRSNELEVKKQNEETRKKNYIKHIERYKTLYKK